MADINVERRGPSIWPWIVGLLVLALLIWAIAEMVTDREEVAVEEPVAPAVPEPEPVQPEIDAVELSAILPLGAEDRGRVVMARGQVVGQPIDDGFWLLTEENEVLFVRSDQAVSPAAGVEVIGQIETNPREQGESWLLEAEMRDVPDWNVNLEFHIAPIEDAPAQRQDEMQAPRTRPHEPGRPGAPGQPGAQPNGVNRY